jgi:hypothetical protein
MATRSCAAATATVPEGELRVGFTRDCAVAPARRLSSAGMPLEAEAWAGGTGQVLLTFPGGCVQVDYPATLGRAELALPRVLDVVRLVPRWRLNQYVARLTEGQERTL